VSKLQTLRDAKTFEDIAKILGFTPSGLSYILYKLPDSKKYNALENWGQTPSGMRYCTIKECSIFAAVDRRKTAYSR
jgi:hypothetical protein